MEELVAEREKMWKKITEDCLWIIESMLTGGPMTPENEAKAREYVERIRKKLSVVHD